MDKRFEAMDKRFEAMDERFESLENRIDRNENNIKLEIDELEQRFSKKHELMVKAITTNLVSTMVEKMDESKKEIETILYYMADIGQKFLTYYTWRPNLNDESDNKFIDCAIVSNADFIVTGNIKDFNIYNIIPVHYQVITPRKFIDSFGGK